MPPHKTENNYSVDYDKLSDMVVSKLKESNRKNRDEEFIQKLVDEMIRHRSPCHNLSGEDVQSIKTFIEDRLKYAKAKGLVKVALAIFILKEVISFIISNLHLPHGFK